MRTDRLRRPRRPSRVSHGALGAALLVTSALLLTGCQSSPAPSTTSSPTRTSAASGSVSTPKASTPAPKPTPVTLRCDQVLTSAQLSALVPTITPASGFTPEKGSDAAKATSDDGVACGYTNPTTGNTVAVSIARPASGDLTALKNTAITTSNVVPTYGVPPQVMGYFTVKNGTGVAEAFAGDFWIAVVSKDYIEPGDAGQVMTGVLANLPK